MSILVITEHDNTALSSATFNAIAAANELPGDIHLLVAGNDCDSVAEEAANIAGITKVLNANAPEYAHAIAENVAPLIVKLAADYSHVLAAATTTGKNIMPRAAALLDVQQVSEITEVLSEDTFVRPIYAGNAMQTVRSTDAIKLITIRATSFEAVAGQGGSASIENIDGTGDMGKSSFVDQQVSSSDRPELTTAKIVISGGRGMKSGDNFPMLESVADKLNAAVGASRAAVDAGYVPNDLQVGQTGKVVAPDLYIAVGISGAIQHLAGMKDSKVIVAINNDAEAPIFQVADYGLVADLFDAIPELEKELG
jgi:electron transfer flavoprotein alpha subunit